MEFTAEMIAGLLDGTVVGDKNAKVHTVGSIDGGRCGALAYLTNPKYEQYVYTSHHRSYWSTRASNRSSRCVPRS